MKLRTKLFVFILLPTILLFAGTVYYVSIKVEEISRNNAIELLYAHGDSLSKDLQKELENPMTSVRAIAQTFEGIIVRGEIPSRDQANNMLKDILNKNASLITSWMFWKENAFDGKDKIYKNTAGHDATGRFMPLWTKSSSGQLLLEPIRNYDQPEIKGNFDHIFETAQSAIFEPYIYEIDGKNQLITSIAAPVMVKGNVVGIVGVDLLLEDIDLIVSEFTFYDTGFSGLISNAGNVIAHQDDALIGTNYFESDAIKNLSDVENLKTSVMQGENAINKGYSNALQTEVYRLFTPINIDKISTPWSAFLTAPEKEVMKDANKLVTTIITISAIAIIILIITILFVTRTITNVITTGVEHAQQIAKGVFSTVIPNKHLKGKDEISDLARDNC